jgi:hypothetical protein
MELRDVPIRYESPIPEGCPSHVDERIDDENETSIMSEVAYLHREADSLGGGQRKMIESAQCIALRIAAQANVKLIPAGFITQSGDIEFILKNAASGKQAYIDIGAGRSEMWVHMISPTQDWGTLVLAESSSVKVVSDWLRI